MKYLAFAACERFGIDPAAFEAKPVEQQIELMAYEMVRNREERSGADAE